MPVIYANEQTSAYDSIADDARDRSSNRVHCRRCDCGGRCWLYQARAAAGSTSDLPASRTS